VSNIGKDIEKAAQLLRSGKLVAIPTETVYGLAANALDAKAVASVFEAKKRPFFDPLIVHSHSTEQILQYVSHIPAPLKQLAHAFWPGPLTLLLPKKPNIADLVTAGLPTVAVRIPNHKLTLDLLKQLDFPLAAPSANPFGYISPTAAEHVDKQLRNEVDYILDGGNCSVGIESTIVGMCFDSAQHEKVCVYRLGGLAIDEIEKVVGKVELKINVSGDPTVPGQLKSHYAPSKKLFLGNLQGLLKQYEGKRLGVLVFGETENINQTLVINLSIKADLKEAAANLFSALRQLDEADVDFIVCEHVPNEGLGLAINDRLNRAAS
jgi:L-threonylcarbamoyladenylate synthase